MVQIIVKEIYLFPVKSLSGIKLDKCIVTKLGIAHPEVPEVVDRKWMVIDENGNFLTGRQLPKMLLIKPKVTKDYLILTADGQKDLKVPIKPPENLLNCRYNDDTQRLSEFLERENLDLAVFGPEQDARKSKDVDMGTNFARDYDEAIFHDYNSFMLISEMSLNDLNSKLEKKVTIRNFRPNFYVSGCDAFSEDNWLNFTIGNRKFFRIRHCTRCLMTTIDPDLGAKSSDQEPLKTLKTYRLNKEVYGSSPQFGIHISLDDDNENSLISIGDKLIV